MKNSFENAWIAPLITDEVVMDSNSLKLHVIDANNEKNRVSVLTLDTEITFCTVSADVCDRLQTAIQARNETQGLATINSLNGLMELLESQGFILFSSDYVYYLLPEELMKVTAQDTVQSVSCRELNIDDLTQFETFIAEIDASEQGEAWVQLMHLKAFGLFVNEQLVCVCSAQPWSPDGKFQNQVMNIADFGIITHPKYRRQGYAKCLIQNIASQLAAQDYTLQFRPQNDNFPAIHLAESLQLNFFGVSQNLVWDGE